MEALSALCNELIRPEPHCHASLVCLSNYLHGDHRHAAGSGKDSIGDMLYFQSFFLSQILQLHVYIAFIILFQSTAKKDI